MKRLVVLAVAMTALAAAPVEAGLINWTDWTSATANTATGTLAGGITVTYTGDIAFAQTSGGIDYWTGTCRDRVNCGNPFENAVVSNRPPDSDIVALSRSNITDTITFSSPVLNPVMSIVSIGQPGGYIVRYDFDKSFTMLSYGAGYWGGNPLVMYHPNADPTILDGEEFHGTIQFMGSVTSISWVNIRDENWHGFQVGVPVPEPASLTLVGLGLIGLCRRLRRG